METVGEASAGGRAGWLEAGFDALAEGGVANVRVEVLAKRLGVTKGGFYWHFRDRPELLSALLADWRDGRIRTIDQQTSRLGGEPVATALRRLLDLYLGRGNPRGTAIELAVRDWARRQTEAADAVAAVDRHRLECVSRLFAQMNFAPEQAFARAYLFYAFIFGQSLLVCDRHAADMARTREMCAQLLVGE